MVQRLVATVPRKWMMLKWHFDEFTNKQSKLYKTEKEKQTQNHALVELNNNNKDNNGGHQKFNLMIEMMSINYTTVTEDDS